MVSGPVNASMVIFSPDWVMSGVTLPVKVDALGDVVGGVINS